MNIWTLFFTDIEDSTGHYERAGATYRAAAARQFDVLRTEIAAHGGEVFRNTGDGLLAAFRDSAAAIDCAASCQRALRQMEWPQSIGELRVRIGLHRGEAERGDGDFHGLTMHHAARVLDAAHGAQILCSEAVCADAGDHCRAATNDLGLFRLRGVPLPMRLFQVDYEAMPVAGFPMPRTPAAFTHKLPASPTRFFGRDAELHDLSNLLAPEPPGRAPRRYGRLVTLLGPGGTGKTRLSLAVGERLLAPYSHAVWFVPLTEVRDAQLLPDLLRTALDIAPEPGRPPLDQVAEMLATQPSLLILDNFEQLVPAGVEIVRRLLESAPRLVCLATSRVRLDLSGGQDFSLAPLLLPPPTGTPEELLRCPSVQLYCDRAQQVRRDFHLGGENASEVARICRALEGIPLAIELAAARAAMLTPRQVLSKLDRPLDFLASRKQDFAHRHRTLRATVAWSYELLPEPLQRTFARLAIFRGGWTLEAAESVAEESGVGTALDDLTELQNCSLIVAEEGEGAMRYRMLEVIREFARERLETSADFAGAAARHHRHFVELACPPADAPPELEVQRMERVDAERENLRVVLTGSGPILERAEVAKKLRGFWMIRGHLLEGRSILHELLKELPVGTMRAVLENDAGILAWSAGDLAAAREHFESALPIFAANHDEKSVAGLLNNLGILANDRGNFAEARDHYHRSLAIYRRLGLQSQLAAALSNLGSTEINDGSPEHARATLLEALQIQRELGEQFHSANTLHNLAEMYQRLGDLAAARRHMGESLAARTALNARHDVAECFLTLANIATDEGLLELAAALLGAARCAAESPGTRPTDRLASELDAACGQLRKRLGAHDFVRASAAGAKLELTSVLLADGQWNPALMGKADESCD